MNPLPHPIRRRLLVALAAVFISLPAGALCFHLWAVRDRGPRAASAPAPKGERRDLAEGLVHVRLSGEGHALGREHGRLLREEIRGMVRYLREELIGSTVARDLLLMKAWQLDERAQERYRKEMRGVADGAGVEYADVLLINSYDDLTHIMGCSSTVVLPSHGEPLRHARNLDYPIPVLARYKVVFDIETRGVRLRTVGFPGYVGVLTGASSRGLGLSSHTSSVPRSRLGTPSGLVYRQMLEEGEHLGEMKAILVRSRRTIGNNLALSDARSGSALALEFDAEHLAERQPEEGRLIVTNHFQTAAMQRHQSGRIWAAESGSSARVSCLRRSLPPLQRVDVHTLRAALSEYRQGPAWRTPANGGTVQSVILEPATGRLWVAKGLMPPVTGAGYVEVAAAWQL